MVRFGAGRGLALFVVLGLVVGCDTVDRAQVATNATTEEGYKLRDLARIPAAGLPQGNVIVNDDIWLGSRSTLNPNGEPLPRSLEGGRGMVLNTLGVPLTFREIVAEVQAQSGILVTIDTSRPNISEDAPGLVGGQDSVPGGGGGQQNGGSSGFVIEAQSGQRSISGSRSQGLPTGGLPTLPTLPTAAGPNQQPGGGTSQPATADLTPEEATQGQTMPVRYIGALSGFLDLVGSYFDFDWEYRNGRIRFYRYVVRSFSLATLPTTSALRTSVNTSGASSGEDVMVTTLDSESTTNRFDEVRRAIESMVGSGAVVVTPATGMLTVAARPNQMGRIADFVKRLNESITRQVTINVKVLFVTLDEGEELTAALRAQFDSPSFRGLPAANTADQNVQFGTVGNPTTPLTGASPFDLLTQGTALGALILQPRIAGEFGGTQLVLNALRNVGNLTEVDDVSVTTLNGQPSPVNVVRRRDYIAEVTQTATDTSVSTAVTTETLTTGFSLHLLPRITDDRHVLLEYGINLRDGNVVALAAFAGVTLSGPDVNIRSFLQQALLRSGSVLVLTGFQQAVDQFIDRELPIVGKLLGGGQAGRQRKQVMVVVLTPVVLDPEKAL